MTVLYIVVRNARISLGVLLGSFGKGILHFSLYPLVNGASIAFFFCAHKITDIFIRSQTSTSQDMFN